MSSSITHSFCIESIRYAYQILGYDTLIKEIEFIHHLHHKSTSESQNIISSDLSSLSTSSQTFVEISPSPVDESKSQIQLSQQTSEIQNQQKEVVLKAKRGRKPLSTKIVEPSDIKPIRIIEPSSSSCTYQLPNQITCSIKRYTTEDPDSTYCYNHYKLNK